VFLCKVFEKETLALDLASSEAGKSCILCSAAAKSSKRAGYQASETTKPGGDPGYAHTFSLNGVSSGEFAVQPNHRHLDRSEAEWRDPCILRGSILAWRFELEELAYIYILASGFKHLYIGLTTKIEQRIWEHKNDAFPNSFTARYNIRDLVYFERFGSIQTAITREKQLKRWSRVKKIRLIVATNPTWRDLSADWGKPVEPFREPGEVRGATDEIQGSLHSASLRSR
jgi:putative endonuclease